MDTQYSARNEIMPQNMVILICKLDSEKKSETQNFCRKNSICYRIL